jgi:hypothetical protein
LRDRSRLRRKEGDFGIEEIPNYSRVTPTLQKHNTHRNKKHFIFAQVT